MKKIVLTGPESTGKTTLAAQLAQHFGTVWVPEFSRQYIANLGRPYTTTDLLEIAWGQMALEDETAASATNGLVFLDTSLEVIKVWSEVRFNYCDPQIASALRQRPPSFYLLCLPDLPWSFDLQRENPHDRDMLLKRYRNELGGSGVPFTEISGSGAERFLNAKNAVATFIKN